MTQKQKRDEQRKIGLSFSSANSHANSFFRSPVDSNDEHPLRDSVRRNAAVHSLRRTRNLLKLRAVVKTVDRRL